MQTVLLKQNNLACSIWRFMRQGGFLENSIMTSLFILSPMAVSVQDGRNKSDILDSLARLFNRAYDLAHGDVLERIEERERLGSTGFGRGVAIPHARIDGIKSPTVAVMRLREPVDFHAADGLPVELVIGLLSPENGGVSHLHALASISRMVRDEKLRTALLEAGNAEALYGLLSNASDQNAA